jgi:sugar phosphate isomerase/epimerase
MKNILERCEIGFMASLEFRLWKPDRVAETLSKMGYQGVEWTMAHFDPRSKSLRELSDLVKISEKYGLEVSEIVVQQDMVTLDEKLRDNRLNLVKECISAASQVGVKTLNVFTGPAPWDPDAPKISRDITEGKAWSLVLEAYQELVEEAERFEVNLAVEAVFGHLCHDYYTVKELLDSIDSKHLGVNMDPSHYALYGNDVAWAVNKLGEKIMHVHLKDVVGKPGMPGDDFMFPLLGEGIIDWNGFAEALNNIGYRGFLSVEFEAFNYYDRILDRDPVKAAQLSMEQIKKLFRKKGT